MPIKIINLINKFRNYIKVSFHVNKNNITSIRYYEINKLSLYIFSLFIFKLKYLNDDSNNIIIIVKTSINKIINILDLIHSSVI